MRGESLQREVYWSYFRELKQIPSIVRIFHVPGHEVQSSDNSTECSQLAHWRAQAGTRVRPADASQMGRLVEVHLSGDLKGLLHLFQEETFVMLSIGFSRVLTSVSCNRSIHIIRMRHCCVRKTKNKVLLVSIRSV